MNMTSSEVRNGQAASQPGPFGYSFLSPMDTPYEPAPVPPPGPALLDDDESTMLDNFFTTMNSNHFNDIWLRGQQNKPMNTFNNIDWSDELPPTFEGSTTTLSQPAHNQRGFQEPGGGMMNNNAGATQDIFQAASVLYQNGMNGAEFNPTFTHNALSGGIYPGINGHMDGQGKSSHPSYPTFKQPNVPARTQPVPTGFHTSKMLFDVHEPIPAERQTSAKSRPLHWGSDMGFMDQGYMAPADVPNEEERTKELLDNLECLEPQSSAANTRAPSPHHTHWNPQNSYVETNGLRAYRNNVDDEMQPKKRQKTLIKEEDEENSDDNSRPKSRRSRGSISKPRRGSSDTIRKSRIQQGSKAPRENLTEEQKRNNHILSEQKRRNLIRQGFDEMCALVPGLRGGGFSKSAMLTQAADWIEDMIRGNEILRAQLSDMNGVNGGLVMPR